MNPNPEEAKRLSRGMSSDMSPEAISKRFDILVELNDLCGYLGGAKKVAEVCRVREEPDEGKRD